MAEAQVLDRRWISRGVDRAPTLQFSMWLVPWVMLLALGIYAAYLCFAYGLNQTNLDNRFAFGLWIYLDLAIIALGAGAFFTGFLVYILRWKDLKAVLHSAVVLGFICYSGAVAVLAVDVGQPLRAWFTFWHPNTHSMLTEVTFCITVYLVVLSIEYLPVLFRNRQLKQIPSFLVFERRLHLLVPVLAGVGAFLSFFHQGSLGGLYGVLRGRPFAFREGILVFPSTFFLFVLSAIAVGPAFVLLTTRLVERVTGKRLAKPEILQKLGTVSGLLLLVYVVAKCIDTLIWLNVTSPAAGFAPWEHYMYQPFGTWILFSEIVLFGLVPGLLLVMRRTRTQNRWLITGALLACGGVLVNRFVLTIQTLALPTLAFDEFMTYWPNWQEVATFGGVIAYGVILYSLSYRYLPLFPQERELAEEQQEVPHVSGR